jgi:hypothetical protein
LNLHRVNDVRQTEIHTAEPLVPQPNSSEDEIAIEKLKRYKLSGIDRIITEMIEAEREHYFMRSTNILILLGMRKNCQSS